MRRRSVDWLRRSQRRSERNAEHAREISESTHAWMAPDLASEERELFAFHMEREQTAQRVAGQNDSGESVIPPANGWQHFLFNESGSLGGTGSGGERASVAAAGAWAKLMIAISSNGHRDDDELRNLPRCSQKLDGGHGRSNERAILPVEQDEERLWPIVGRCTCWSHEHGPPLAKHARVNHDAITLEDDTLRRHRQCPNRQRGWL